MRVFKNWIKQLFTAKKRVLARPRGKKLNLEHLEERITPTTYTVSLSSDSSTTAPYTTGSIRWAVYEANQDPSSAGADTINLNTGLTINLNDGALAITRTARSVAIVGHLASDGTPNDAISANNSGQVFQVGNGVIATLTDLTVEDAQATGLNGGGIYNDGVLTVNSCTIQGNQAANGGGIFNDSGATLNLSDCTISSNTATTGAGGGLDNNGGAVTVSGATSIFTGNRATTDGGGIFGTGMITVSGTTFLQNFAVSGAGIYDLGTLSISGSTFSENAANSSSGEGGGIYNDGTLTVTSSTFGDSISSSGSTVGASYNGNSAFAGGGIFNDSTGVLTATTSSLSGNSATADGGGLDNAGTAAIAYSTFGGDLASSNSGNSARTGGGIDNQNGTLTVTGSTFNKNSGGGAIYSSGSVTLIGSTVDGNSGSASVGGGIDNAGGTLNLLSSIVAGNTSTGTSASDIVGSVADTTASTNNLIGTGGAGGLSTTTNQVGVSSGVTVLGDYGGPTLTMALLPTSLALQGGTSTLTTLTAADAAGNTTLTVADSAFLAAGAIIQIDSEQMLVTQVNSSTSVTVTPAQNGTSAAMHVSGASVTLVIFVNGKYSHMTDQRGFPRSVNRLTDIGAFETQTDPFRVTTTADPGQIFDKLSLREAINLANVLPGNNTITFSMTNATILLTGGLPQLYNGEQVKLSQTVGTQWIDGNGSIKIQGYYARTLAVDSNVTAIISGVNLTGGDATSGAAIDNLGILNVNNDTFLNNNASDDGGAIYNSDQLTVVDCSFGNYTTTSNGNTATTNGGAIYNHSGDVATIVGSTFSANSSTNGDGGAVYNAGAMTIVDSTFGGVVNNGNTANAGDGGAIYNSGTLSIAASTINENSAGTAGGGLYVASGAPTLLSTIVLGNFLNGSAAANDIQAANGVTLHSASSYNLIGVGGAGGLSGSNYNQVGVSVGSADLTPLGYYGGPTETIFAQAGSPALQNGNALLTTLSAQVMNGTDTSLSVAGTKFLAVGEIIGIDSEQMQITGISGSTVTVMRGVNNTTAASHASGADVVLAADQRGFARTVNGSTDVGAFETQPNALVVTSTADQNALGQVTLRSAINLANQLTGNNTVTFASYLAGDTIVLNADAGALTLYATGGIETVDGGGVITVQGSGAGSTYQTVLQVDSNTAAAIDNLTIQGGYTQTKGGGIVNNGTLTIGNSALNNNTATDSGGGIYDTGTLTLNNTSFSDNAASTDNGGAIDSTNSLIISGGYFSGNSAVLDGGAIDNSGTLSVSGGTIFDSNTVSSTTAGDGGAIYSSGPLTLNGGDLTNNTSSFLAGAIYSTASAMISNATIDDNSTTGAHSIGGIDNAGGTMTIVDTELNDNSSELNAGAFSNSGTATITASTFDGNQATTSTSGEGGAIYNSGSLTVTGSTFSDNSSYSDGGAIYNSSTGTLIVNGGSTFMNNGAADAVAADGGAIYSADSLTISGGVFTGNYANQNGGALYITGTANITGSTFDNNNADISTTGDGGAIYNAGTMTISASSFNENLCYNDGGAIDNTDSLIISGSALSGNDGALYGGGVFNSDLLTVNGCTFTNNSAYNNGGALDNTGTMGVIGSTFDGNFFVSNGGAIYTSTSGTNSATISNSTFFDNSAYGDGGAVYSTSSSSVPTSISKSTLTGNSAPTGGGIRVSSGTFALFSTIVVGNTNGSSASDISGTVSGSASTYNLIGTGGAGGLTNTNHNQTNVSVAGAGLGTLSSNGGPTQTIALLSGSSALLAGSGLLTTLSAMLAAGASNTSLTVVSATFLVLGEVIQIDSEQMLITKISGTTVTVTRGYNNTTAAGHASGANVVLPADQRGFARTVSGSTDVGAFETGLLAIANPASVTVNAGQTAAFTASASGNPAPNVQWQMSADGGNTWTNVSGATSTTLTLNNVAAGMTGDQYQAVFTNSNGNLTTTAATLTVNQTFVVTDLSDNASDPGSLRSIVNAIDNDQTARTDTVTFAAGLSGTIALTNGLLLLSRTFGPVAISGPGETALTISGSNTSQLFEVGPDVLASFSGITFSSGLTPNFYAPAYYGGAISNSGTLVIANSAFTNNLAPSFGGAISNYGMMTINNSAFSNNQAPQNSAGGIWNNGRLTVNNSGFSNNLAAFGGGIYNLAGTLTADNDAFSSNTASFSGGGIYNNDTMAVAATTFAGDSAGYGGGIFNEAMLTVADTTFSGNSASVNGGGINNNAGTLDVSNSTLAGNTADFGGGIGNYSAGIVSFSTISGNSATTNGGGIDSEIYTGDTLNVIDSTIVANAAPNGGGIYANNNGALAVNNSTISNNSAASGNGGGVDASGGPVSLLSSIVAGNFTTSTTTPNDIAGALNAAESAYNLIGTGGAGGLTSANSNQINVSVANAGLGALKSNGGPTQTIALLPGSAALQTGNTVLTTLATSLSAGIDSFTAADATFLAAGEVVQIDSEQMLITSISGTTAYVTRGFNNSADVGHASGANVVLPTDQRGLARTVNGFTDVGAVETQLPPLLSGLPAVNGSSAVINIVSASGDGTTATITTDGTPHGFWVGELVTLTGVTPSGPGGLAGAVTVTGVPSATTFQFASTYNGSETLTGATVTAALAGAQRSMVDSIVYNFSEPVNLTAAAFSINAVINNTTTGSDVGVAPLLNVAPVPFTNEWVVTFTDPVNNSVIGNSIADGAYSISINPALVTAVSDGQSLSAGETDTFYRLYGDVTGAESVKNVDVNAFNRAWGNAYYTAAFNAALDYNDDGKYTNIDANAFNREFNTRYSVATTI